MLYPKGTVSEGTSVLSELEKGEMGGPGWVPSGSSAPATLQLIIDQVTSTLLPLSSPHAST